MSSSRIDALTQWAAQHHGLDHATLRLSAAGGDATRARTRRPPQGTRSRRAGSRHGRMRAYILNKFLVEPCVFISRDGTTGTSKEDREGGKGAKQHPYAQTGEATLDVLVPHMPLQSEIVTVILNQFRDVAMKSHEMT